ncbi:hypothetical protein C6A85_34590, partial [Mycobacterium sp. ITM-2017-0098]
QDNRRSLTYYYRGGWDDPSSSPSAVSADDRLVDLAKFDFEKTRSILRGAPETVGVKRADVTSTWLRIQAGEDPSTPDAVSIEIVV